MKELYEELVLAKRDEIKEQLDAYIVSRKDTPKGAFLMVSDTQQLKLQIILDALEEIIQRAEQVKSMIGENA